MPASARFRVARPLDTIAAVLREDPDWSKAAALAPLKLQLLIRRCLQKNPHVRLHDIADARIEIDDISREPLTPAVDTGSIDGTRLIRATPRTMWALAAAAVVLVGLGAVAGVDVVGSPGASTESVTGARDDHASVATGARERAIPTGGALAGWRAPGLRCRNSRRTDEFIPASAR